MSRCRVPGRIVSRPVHHQRHEQIRDPGAAHLRAGPEGLPIRQFFDDRLTAGLKDAQAAYGQPLARS
jgi:hypothetical protein